MILSYGNSLDITSPLWEQACRKFKVHPNSELDIILHNKINEEYINLIRKLSTENLERIIHDYHHREVRRAKRTVDEILSELTERVFLMEIEDKHEKTV